LPIDEAGLEPVPEDSETEEPAEEAESGEVEEPAEEVETEPEPEGISFSAELLPFLENRCVDCHGSDGGFDASTYELLMSSGDNGPGVIPGDPDGSLLIQKLVGTHEEGDLMPPPPLRPFNEELIQLFIDWIAAGAPEN
jgi:hypothetical protein